MRVCDSHFPSVFWKCDRQFPDVRRKPLQSGWGRSLQHLHCERKHVPTATPLLESFQSRHLSAPPAASLCGKMGLELVEMTKEPRPMSSPHGEVRVRDQPRPADN